MAEPPILTSFNFYKNQHLAKSYNDSINATSNVAIKEKLKQQYDNAKQELSNAYNKALNDGIRIEDSKKSFQKIARKFLKQTRSILSQTDIPPVSQKPLSVPQTLPPPVPPKHLSVSQTLPPPVPPKHLSVSQTLPPSVPPKPLSVPQTLPPPVPQNPPPVPQKSLSVQQILPPPGPQKVGQVNQKQQKNINFNDFIKGKGIIKQYNANCYFRSAFALIYKVYNESTELQAFVNTIDFDKINNMHIIDFLLKISKENVEPEPIYIAYLICYLMRYIKFNNLAPISPQIDIIKYPEYGPNQYKSSILMTDLYKLFCYAQRVEYGGMHDAFSDVIHPFFVGFKTILNIYHNNPCFELSLNHITNLFYFADKRRVDASYIDNSLIDRLNFYEYGNMGDENDINIIQAGTEKECVYSMLVSMPASKKNYNTDIQQMFYDMTHGLLNIQEDWKPPAYLNIPANGTRVMQWEHTEIPDNNRFIMLGLNRVSYDLNTKQQIKLQNKILINNMLFIDTIDEQGGSRLVPYLCIGVIRHGGGVQGGHYVSYVRYDQHWICTDDNSLLPAYNNGYFTASNKNFTDDMKIDIETQKKVDYISQNTECVLYQRMEVDGKAEESDGVVNVINPIFKLTFYAVAFYFGSIILIILILLYCICYVSYNIIDMYYAPPTESREPFPAALML